MHGHFLILPTKNRMQPTFTHLPETKLVGHRIRNCLADNQVVGLWRRFMPRQREIQQVLGPELYAVQQYDSLLDPATFTPRTPFDHWAARAVADSAPVPEGMESCTVPAGLYAVFVHRGLPETFPETSRYIFTVWLPGSGYVLDHRPHLQVMGASYRPNDPDSEETVWVPVRPKS